MQAPFAFAQFVPAIDPPSDQIRHSPRDRVGEHPGRACCYLSFPALGLHKMAAAADVTR